MYAHIRLVHLLILQIYERCFTREHHITYSKCQFWGRHRFSAFKHRISRYQKLAGNLLAVKMFIIRSNSTICALNLLWLLCHAILCIHIFYAILFCSIIYGRKAISANQSHKRITESSRNANRKLCKASADI